MKKLKMIMFLFIAIVCLFAVVYAEESEVEEKRIMLVNVDIRDIGGINFEVEGEKPKKINDEFDIIINWPAMPFEYKSADFTIKYPKNQAEFISCELNSEMYINRTVSEESEYGYIDCCIVDYDELNSGNLKFKFKAINGGELKFTLDVESVYAVIEEPQAEGNEAEKSVKYISDNSVNLLVDVPIKVSSINILEKDKSYYLTGINEKTKLGEITSLISTDYVAIISKDGGYYLIDPNDTNIIKTGDRIIFGKKYSDDTYYSINEYKTIIYGDTNGDGMINSGDALAIVKNKTNAIPFTEYEFKESGRVQEKDRGTDAVPSAIDALMIIKHKLGKYKIVQ